MTPADLRTARKAIGLTQKGLAKALRMGAHGWQSISKWESDANALGVPGPVQVAIEGLLKSASGSMVPVKRIGKGSDCD